MNRADEPMISDRILHNRVAAKPLVQLFKVRCFGFCSHSFTWSVH